MRKNSTRLILSLALAAAALTLSPLASAEDIKMVGVITKLQVAGDGKSAQATLKDGKSGEAVTINISDDETLDKFKDKRIQEGDEIRAKYDSNGNKSKSFKRTAGC
jgi:Skp family chaperone for outer membrane proteins